MSGRERSASRWSLDLYLEYLSTFTPPEGAFDANRAWEHTYDVFPIYALLHLTGKAWSKVQKGVLRLKRTPIAGEEAVRLQVVSEVTFLDWLPTRTQRTTATATCATDALGTPKAWELSSVALSAKDGSTVRLSELRESGAMRDGSIELRFDGGRRRLEVAERATSNWSLFDALQRLPRDAPPDGEFDMLEDLRLRRRRQYLVAEGTTEVTTAAGPLRLYGFRQMGEGISPTNYWLDEHGRLLLALQKTRAWIWQDEAALAAMGD